MTLPKLCVVFGVGVLGLLGCKETTSSCNVRTAGIAMLTTVTARSESDVRVRTELLVGGDESNTYAVLDGCDELFAEADGERKEMRTVSDGVYEAKFDKGEEGVEYRIIFEREQDKTADGNIGSLPAPFEITSDFGNDPISRNDDDMEITWEPADSDDDMSLEVDDDAAGCIYDETFEIAGDPGTFTLGDTEKTTLESTDEKEPETCDLTGTLTRQRTGSEDAELDSESKFVLRQVRSFGFVSAP